MCVTSSHAPGNASVHVTVGSEVGTLLNAFVFDSGMTPTVSSLSVSQGSVSGSEELVIHGSGFEDFKTFLENDSQLTYETTAVSSIPHVGSYSLAREFDGSS